LLGLGIANLAAGFFQGFPINSSSSRTPVAEAAGARTQLAGIVGAIAVALLLLMAPGSTPHSSCSRMAAVVISSALGLIEVSDLSRIFRIQRWEFWLSIVCFVGVAVLGAIAGIGLAIVIAIVEFLWDGWGCWAVPKASRATTALSTSQSNPEAGPISLGCSAVLCQC
jgi:MFS superfamily sulfate permease-like transporter